jgi:PadR family transcriptional regulator PadR
MQTVTSVPVREDSVLKHGDSATSDDAGAVKILPGTLDLVLLAIVAIEPLHAYAITKRVLFITGQSAVLHQGAIYPALQRLRDRGWIHLELAEAGSRRKRYVITESGLNALSSRWNSWQRYAAFMDRLMAQSTK